jgi:3-deoxy-D-arabino-heptulosonate 7-phosphate (DAHP) synthase
MEVHDDPEKAFSDGTESITPSQLKELIKMGKKVALAVDRKI